MILCCGEALIDMIPAKTAGGATGYVPHSGGAVFNTAIALGRLGTPAGLFTGLAADRFGQQLLAALAGSNVDASLAVVSPRPCTLAFVHLTDGQAEYSFYDENSAGVSLTAADLPDLPDETHTLFFGGISLCNLPAADTYAELAAREAGARVIMLDPNVRPGFARDEQAYRARLGRMLALAGIVKVSDEDLAWICPAEDRLEARVEWLLQQGPGLVIVTRGSEGAEGYLRSGGHAQAKALRAEVADTVGAGDTFNAGFLARADEMGLLREASEGTADEAALAGCLAFGARAAAVTVSRPGANPPWRHELENISEAQ